MFASCTISPRRRAGEGLGEELGEGLGEELGESLGEELGEGLGEGIGFGLQSLHAVAGFWKGAGGRGQRHTDRAHASVRPETEALANKRANGSGGVRTQKSEHRSEVPRAAYGLRLVPRLVAARPIPYERLSIRLEITERAGRTQCFTVPSALLLQCLGGEAGGPPVAVVDAQRVRRADVRVVVEQGRPDQLSLRSTLKTASKRNLGSVRPP